MTDKPLSLTDQIAIEVAYCRHVELPVTDEARRIVAIVERKHLYWRAGELDCPRDIKAGNGELHTLRCKICGEDSPRKDWCGGRPND